MNGEKIRERRKELGMTQEELAEKLGISTRSVINYEQGHVIPKSKQAILHNVLFQIDVRTSLENSAREPEAIFVSRFNEMQTMYVPLVSQYAQAGYLSGFDDPEYLESLPKIPFASDVEHKGEYVCFEVRGDSMDDGSSASILAHDILLCRNVRRDYWKSRLHLHKWKNYVIVHQNEGILVKQIINHDVERGLITIHSLNEMYSDKELDLREISQIFNVIEVRRK